MQIDKTFHHNLSLYLAYNPQRREKAVNLTSDLFDSTRLFVCLYTSGDDIKSAFMSVGHNCFVAQVLQKTKGKHTLFD